ncbi:MAG: biotin--[acetyl-CoA-carboxylase] ligase [Acidobacteria bacterium]|nr:biotin--[acetyl-CoA-carboxylase] ligase [Acidobacteriota bacterium]
MLDSSQGKPDVNATHSCPYAPIDAEISGLEYCRTVVGFESVGSTNELAKDWALKNTIRPGTLILADEQTDGRGRLNHSWHSPRGRGIYASLLLAPLTPPDKASFVTLTTGLALHQAISGLISPAGNRLDIKWPNDIIWENRKLAGILAESVIKDGQQIFIVVGFGINVTNEHFPPEIQSRAVSLYQINRQVLSRHDVLLKILPVLENRLRQLATADYERIRYDWEQASSFARGRKVKYFDKHGPVMGITNGLKQDGALQIVTRNHQVVDVYHGEIFEY